MTSNHIRRVELSDIPAIFHVRTSVVENFMSEQQLAEIGITRGSISELLAEGSACGWCALVNEKVVGFSLAFRKEREISGLFVLPEYEKNGFGTLLLDEAVVWLTASDEGPIRLATERKTSAHTFYQKRGWIDLDHGPKGDILDGDHYMEYDPSNVHSRSE